MVGHRPVVPLVMLVLLVQVTPLESKRNVRENTCLGKHKRAGSSLLWRLNTTPPSYFFGTIHVPYRLVWHHVPDNVKRAFHYSQAVYFELRLTDPQTVQALTSCQQLPAGQQLQQLLPRQLYERLQRHLSYVRHMLPLWLSDERQQQSGSSAGQADHLFQAIVGNWRLKRPVWLMLMVNTLTESDIRARGSPVLDLFLAQQAERLHKLTGAVERVEEQCRPLNGLNMSQVIFALNHTLTQQERVRSGIAALPLSTDDLIHHYNCGDLDRAVFDTDASQMSPSVFKVPPLQSSLTVTSHRRDLQRAQLIDRYFRDELIYKRNQRMGERILDLLWNNPHKSFFFAFGAGHFLGNFTVLDVVQRAGYRVTRVGRRERIRRFHHRSSHSSFNFGRYLQYGDESRAHSDAIDAKVDAEKRRAFNRGRSDRDSKRTQSKEVDRRQVDSFSDLWVRMETSPSENVLSSYGRRTKEAWFVTSGGRGLISRSSDIVWSASLRSMITLVTAISVLTPPRIIC